jgi:hypothetical protein
MSSCDLGSDDDLIGSVELENTGNVDAEFTVSFTWLLGDGGKIEADDETYTLVPGRTKLVFFKESADIDTQLSFQDHPGYFDSTNCKAKASIDFA